MVDLATDRWTWTAESYEAAAAAGIFGSEPRLELLDGEVYHAAAMRPPRALTVGKLLDRFSSGLDRDRWIVRSQLPVRLDDRSEPEPDLWIARGPADRYWERHPAPADLALVVEVADTSLAFDRHRKIPRYAEAGVPEAWLVSLPERTVQHSAEPRPDGYQSLTTIDVEGVVNVLGVEIAVADILPPQ